GAREISVRVDPLTQPLRKASHVRCERSGTSRSRTSLFAYGYPGAAAGSYRVDRPNTRPKAGTESRGQAGEGRQAVNIHLRGAEEGGSQSSGREGHQTGQGCTENRGQGHQGGAERGQD